jgi:hypothetical protein
MTNSSGPRTVLDFDKVDRACEIAVMDWLQWAEFQDEDKAQFALTMIAKRKAAYESLQAELADIRAESVKELEYIRNENVIMRAELDLQTSKLNLYTLQASQEINELKAKAEKLVEALRVYAADNYCGLKVGDPLDEQAAKLIYSAGHIAREALKEWAKDE